MASKDSESGKGKKKEERGRGSRTCAPRDREESPRRGRERVVPSFAFISSPTSHTLKSHVRVACLLTLKKKRKGTPSPSRGERDESLSLSFFLSLVDTSLPFFLSILCRPLLSLSPSKKCSLPRPPALHSSAAAPSARRLWRRPPQRRQQERAASRHRPCPTCLTISSE